MSDRTVAILDSDAFVVSDDRGDIEASSSTTPLGMFTMDTRYLSVWRLSVNGCRLSALSVSEQHYFQARFFLIPGKPSPYVNPTVSLIRDRSISRSVRERIVVFNHSAEPVSLTIRLDVASDFADIFEIKNAQQRREGKFSAKVQDGRLRLSYKRDSFCRETIVTSSAQSDIDEQGLTFNLRLAPHSEWETELNVETLGSTGLNIRTELQGTPGREPPQLLHDLQEWLDRAPRIVTDCDSLKLTYGRSLRDLAALRHHALVSRRSLPAAGLPWFMTNFGRDSIIASLQTVPFIPELSTATTLLCAIGQGTGLDDLREMEPGKIFHEFRFGETAAFEEQPHTPYYGSADTTPLWIILLDEYEQWSGDVALVRQLEGYVRAALRWIDEYADLLGTGYIWYQRRNLVNGLENQCWKDSWDSISYRDGRLPGFPRATCELQGYAYDAKMRAARLAREIWNDVDFAVRLEREALELKHRFNRDFWISDGDYYALALDPDGGQVDALSSNIGHLLWSGIVPEDRADAIATHLLGPRLFSGWGVRTLAVGEGRYNPLGYHNGTVWPCDNSLIAWGLWRYGFRTEAGRITEAIFDAARHFHGRLPEAFAGYDRERTEYPVEYPTACSPQTWSTGAPLLLLRVMLGMQPYLGELTSDPNVPASFGRIELLGIPGRWGTGKAKSW